MAATGVWRQPARVPVTADGAAGDVPWPKVQRRIAQLIQRDEFFTEQEQDNFENIDPVEIRERLAERGIVDGKVVDPEKLGSDPFIRQVMADVERATGTDALETYTTKGGHTYRPGDALDSHTDENDSVIRLVIDHVDEEHVWYTTPDMPERGVAEMFRPLFETYPGQWCISACVRAGDRQSARTGAVPNRPGDLRALSAHCAGKGAFRSGIPERRTELGPGKRHA